MSTPDIRAKLIDIIETETSLVEADFINSEAWEDLIDSLDFLQIICGVEDSFDIEISDEDLPNLASFDAIVSHLTHLVNKQEETAESNSSAMMMDLQTIDVQDRAACLTWIEGYFYPEGLKCVHCGADSGQNRSVGQTKRSELDVYRCRQCRRTYNLYSGTALQRRYFTPKQTILLFQGLCQGKTITQLTETLEINRNTISLVKRQLQAHHAFPQALMESDIG